MSDVLRDELDLVECQGMVLTIQDAAGDAGAMVRLNADAAESTCRLMEHQLTALYRRLEAMGARKAAARRHLLAEDNRPALSGP